MSVCTYRTRHGVRGYLYHSKRSAQFTEVSGAKTKGVVSKEVPENSTPEAPLVTAKQGGTSSLPKTQQSYGTVEDTDASAVDLPSVSSSFADKPVSQETQRKSLSSKFFESKGQTKVKNDTSDVYHEQSLSIITRRPKPYGDDATEISEKSPDFACAVSSSDEETEELLSVSTSNTVTGVVQRGGNVAAISEKFSRQQIMDDDNSYQNRPTSFPPYMTITAGDGNPVRHSLISLVMEEDVPLLMEAMAEKLDFEFEDVASVPSSSSDGIIRNPTSAQRKKQRAILRIGFSNLPPAVFSYPDEATATEFSEWHPGEDITFEEYQQICEEERQKYEERLEASKWQTSFITNGGNETGSLLSVLEQPTVSDFALGVTSRISYASTPPYSSNTNFGAANVSLIAGK
ncbi:unnamed protein product [Enterobius vermicularis]|uniref:Flocculation protein FLO11-like n=1 Tax=Enterobius vermicularis TaxID=51028 RepID=A0A0N4VGR0_ENTVE|nr:unnamed protein product [Enterobius vermicularis]